MGKGTNTIPRCNYNVICSKAWLKAWTTSVPVLEFPFDHNDRDTLGIVVKSIDNSLSILKQQRAFIQAFSFNTNLESNEGALNSIFDQFEE
ncbi:putative F-box/LRR-repeat protein [Senna tora]|uniref:Putative F-box/LRR-repeat protein n=1 Tax=Senna tora TaxID=362788 RepID=A0A834XAD3_9FABA|nr:putative F-box/LRR-repeat protein [Senna tora]